MKYLKILMMIVTVSFFASCSDDDDYNTKEATVGFEKAELVFSEGAGLQEIPVFVSNKHRNGDIKFRIEVEEFGAEPAVKDSMYYITGYDFNIPADSLVDRVNVEIKFINDRIPTANRQFKMNIVGLKGANAGITSTIVTLEDNDGEAFTYESLFGKYNFEMDFIQNGPVPVLAVANMGGAANQADPRYNKELLLTTTPNLGGLGPVKLQFPMSYTYDQETKAGEVGFIMNKKVSTIENGDKTFQFILLNTEANHELDNITAPFTMEKKQLMYNGQPVLDKNGNAIYYNAPSEIKFSHTAKAFFYQTAGTQEEQGNFGQFKFKKLTYVE